MGFNADEADEMMNNILATGAVFGALVTAGVDTRNDVDEDMNATNNLIVRFPFMRSPYRLTIERVPDEEF